MTKEFLIARDYGMGGIWATVKANTDEEVRDAYPCFEVVSERPEWMTDDVKAQLITAGLDSPELKAICEDSPASQNAPSSE